MTTTVEENLLNAELQELYLKNKQWITDLDFLEKELQFLSGFQKKKLSPSSRKNGENVALFSTISNQQLAFKALKADLFKFLHQIEGLIKRPKQVFSFKIIETYAALEAKTNNSLRSFAKLKEMCVGLNKQKHQIA